VIEWAGVVKQQSAHLAPEPGAHGYAGEEWDERTLEGTGHDNGAGVALGTKVAAEPAARPERELAVARRQRDAPADLGHASGERHGPGRADDINDDAGIALAQQPEQRLGHHHVADPGGADDE